MAAFLRLPVHFTALVLALASPAAWATNIIINGSFEDPVVSPQSAPVFPSITSWTGGANGIEIRNDLVGTAQDGSNFVELDTSANSSMWQDVTTNAGLSYKLSLFYSPRIVRPITTNGIEIYWENLDPMGVVTGSSLLDTLNGDGTNLSDHNWQEFTYDVIGSGSDRLRFVAVTDSDQFGGSLDNVSLVAAVPEPASASMALGALAFAAVVRRFRRQR